MTAEPFADVDLAGAFDFHVHTAPDVRPRTHTALELAELAAAAGMAGFVVKSHTEPTTGRAAAVRARFPDLKVYGGITLNAAAGGIVALNVRATLAAGGRIVWLPTVDGRGERSGKKLAGGIAMTDAQGRVTAELRAVLETVAEADAILATAHAADYELLPVVRAAREVGVKRILVNHPEIFFLQFSVDLQQELRDAGAVLERCYPRPEAADGFGQIARELREVGVDSSILATDLGRADLPSPIDGLRRMIHELKQRGFSGKEISRLTRENPLKLLR